VDLTYGFCFLIETSVDPGSSEICSSNILYVGPIIVALPLWFRLAQCLRQYYDSYNKMKLLNALKYAMGICVVVTGSFHPKLRRHGEIREPGEGIRAAWITSVVVATCYAFVWDCTQDFGLWDPKNGMLRAVRIYPQRWVYYALMVSNLGLRFMWTMYLTYEDERVNQRVVPLLMILEIYRRFQWSIFRIEWEEVNHGRAKSDSVITSINPDDDRGMASFYGMSGLTTCKSEGQGAAAVEMDEKQSKQHPTAIVRRRSLDYVHRQNEREG